MSASIVAIRRAVGEQALELFEHRVDVERLDLELGAPPEREELRYQAPPPLTRRAHDLEIGEHARVVDVLGLLLDFDLRLSRSLNGADVDPRRADALLAPARGPVGAVGVGRPLPPLAGAVRRPRQGAVALGAGAGHGSIYGNNNYGNNNTTALNESSSASEPDDGQFFRVLSASFFLKQNAQRPHT